MYWLSCFLRCCLVVLLLPSLNAQDFPTGLLNNSSRYDSLPVLPQYHPGEKADEVRISVDLRPYCPVAGNQGETGSCVGWAVGYGAMTINTIDLPLIARFLTETAKGPNEPFEVAMGESTIQP
ncbi:MAG: hypothetical protein HC821_04405, partial [Lewinella sp.]|nr:hypothetical protein [Lewinella sp.]